MKKLFMMPIAALLMITTSAFSQNIENNMTSDWDPKLYQVGTMYPGYIIKLEGDTIRGFLKAGSRCSVTGIGSSNQNQAVFYVNKTDRKPAGKFKPSEIKGYRIADKEYQSINFSGGLLKKPNFNLVLEDGPIRVYEWYSTVPNFLLLTQQSGESLQDFDKRRYESRIIIAKDPKAPIEHNMLALSFSKKMSIMTEDKPELAEKIINKEKGYTFLNLFEVIQEYNKSTTTKK